MGPARGYRRISFQGKKEDRAPRFYCRVLLMMVARKSWPCRSIYLVWIAFKMDNVCVWMGLHASESTRDVDTDTGEIGVIMVADRSVCAMRSCRERCGIRLAACMEHRLPWCHGVKIHRSLVLVVIHARWRATYPPSICDMYYWNVTVSITLETSMIKSYFVL